MIIGGIEALPAFLVARNGVRAVWKAGSAIRDEDIRSPDLPMEADRTVAVVEVALATKWLAALHRRDFGALTRFLFKMHDNSVLRKCEGKAAAVPANLADAISCLTTDELFMDVLVPEGSPTQPPPFCRAIAKKNRPSWSKRWRSDVPAG